MDLTTGLVIILAIAFLAYVGRDLFFNRDKDSNGGSNDGGGDTGKTGRTARKD